MCCIAIVENCQIILIALKIVSDHLLSVAFFASQLAESCYFCGLQDDFGKD